MNVQLIFVILFMYIYIFFMIFDFEKFFIIYIIGEYCKKIFFGKKYQVFDLLVIIS